MSRMLGGTEWEVFPCLRTREGLLRGGQWAKRKGEEGGKRGALGQGRTFKKLWRLGEG